MKKVENWVCSFWIVQSFNNCSKFWFFSILSNCKEN